jgi:NADPH:quinone reductase
VRAIEAVAFGGPEVLNARQLSAPVAGAGEAVIDVAIAPVLFLIIYSSGGRVASSIRRLASSCWPKMHLA